MKAARSNMYAAGVSNNKVKYSRLAADDDGYIDLQVRHTFATTYLYCQSSWFTKKEAGIEQGRAKDFHPWM